MTGRLLVLFIQKRMPSLVVAWVVPEASNLIQFEISGPGEIVANDNGNAADLVSFHSKERNAFSGLLLVIVRSKPGEKGDITLKALSNGLLQATMVVKGE